MSQFKVGDVVALKSGGPRMTIEELADYSGFGEGPVNGAKCTWFVGDKKSQDVFAVEALQVPPPPQYTV